MDSIANEVKKYDIVCVTLFFLTFVTSCVLSLSVFCGLKRHQDPARSYLIPVRFAFINFDLFCFFIVLYYSLHIALYWITTNHGILFQTAVYASVSGAFFQSLTEVFVFLTLVALSGCISGETKRIVQYPAYIAAFLLSGLAVATFGLRCYHRNMIYGDEVSGSLTVKQLSMTIIRMDFAFKIIILFPSLATTVWSVIIKTRHNDKPATYLLVSCLLWLLQTTYDLAIFGKYTNLATGHSERHLAPYVDVLDVLFICWPLFIVLAILTALSRKRVGGMWSTSQVWKPTQQTADQHGLQQMPFQGHAPPGQPGLLWDAQRGWMPPQFQLQQNQLPSQQQQNQLHSQQRQQQHPHTTERYWMPQNSQHQTAATAGA